MSLDMRMEHKLTQTLKMTPQLRQAVELLLLNRTDLQARVERELLENVTLEVVPDSEGDAVGDHERQLRAEADRSREDLSEQHNDANDTSFDWERLSKDLTRKDRAGEDGPSVASGPEDLPPIETNLTYDKSIRGESLAEYLLGQLRLMRCNDDELAAAEAIIGNLDGRGYLVATLDEIAEQLSLDAELVGDALELVQGLDPLGCGARDLAECLRIQARVVYAEDDTFERILTDEHLGNLERRNYQAIARDLELDLDDVVEYHRMITRLEPTPGRGFDGGAAGYVTPDVYVHRINGQWVASLNEEGLPDLRISREYQRLMKDRSKEEQKYIADKLAAADFLIKALEKRRRTILRVMEKILERQRDFFEHGRSALKPMVLQDIADAIEVHNSTVSRVTSNKYVATPFGTLRLKDFFTQGVPQSGGADLSGETIKVRIREMIDGEDPKKPLSDQAIADQLASEGISVARRTVAKYREAMKIFSSSQRKKLF